MKKLRLVQQGYENFTGQFGRHEFVDGVSVDLLGRVERDRIAASIQCTEIAESGEEIDAGPAARILTTGNIAVEVVPEQAVMSEDELKVMRLKELIAIVTAKQGDRVLHTKESLMKIADKGGIEELRKLAEPFKVRSKSIVGLIDAILDAQDRVTADIARMEARARAEIETGIPTAIVANVEPTAVDANLSPTEVANAAEAAETAALAAEEALLASIAAATSAPSDGQSQE